MPLDVQPLSPARRGMMLLVLMALFCASVGFAQLLVVRSHAAPAIAWNFPAPFKPVDLDDNEPDEVQVRALGEVGGHERLLRGLVFDTPSRLTPAQQLAVMHELFEALFDGAVTAAHPASIGGRVGLELDGVSEDGEFLLLRMVIVQNRAVAISYSGAASPTDWDKLYFNNLCQRVSLQGVPRAKRK